MMELVLEEADTFKRSIDAISVLINEAEFIVDDKGVSLKATDPSQISMVDFSFKKEAFKEYRIDGTVKIGVDLNQLSRLVARAKTKDELLLKLEEDSNNLSLSFRGASKRNFSVPLIDISSADLPTPKIDFDSEIKLMAGILQDSFKDASLLSSHITLEVKGDSFFVLADSSKGNFRNELTKDDEALVSIKSKSDSTAMFPLDYLTSMVKAAQSATEVSLFMKKDAPILLKYAIGEAEITYFLAPRIESD